MYSIISSFVAKRRQLEVLVHYAFHCPLALSKSHVASSIKDGKDPTLLNHEKAIVVQDFVRVEIHQAVETTVRHCNGSC